MHLCVLFMLLEWKTHCSKWKLFEMTSKWRSGSYKAWKASALFLFVVLFFRSGFVYYYYYEELTAAPSHWSATQLHTLLYPKLFRASLFTPSQEVSIPFKSSFMTSSHLNCGQPAFCFSPRQLAEKDNLW